MGTAEEPISLRVYRVNELVPWCPSGVLPPSIHPAQNYHSHYYITQWLEVMFSVTSGQELLK